MEFLAGLWGERREYAHFTELFESPGETSEVISTFHNSPGLFLGRPSHVKHNLFVFYTDVW